MSLLTVSARVAQVLADHTSTIFGVMGNGNAFFLDAAETAGIDFTAVRHEGASVPAADACYRVSGKLAAATTTYGPGFTNVVTGLAEAVKAQIPVVLITGDAPAAGPRPWDVDQHAIAAAVGAPHLYRDPEKPRGHHRPGHHPRRGAPHGRRPRNPLRHRHRPGRGRTGHRPDVPRANAAPQR